jgi:hypothetical protein
LIEREAEVAEAEALCSTSGSLERVEQTKNGNPE